MLKTLQTLALTHKIQSNLLWIDHNFTINISYNLVKDKVFSYVKEYEQCVTTTVLLMGEFDKILAAVVWLFSWLECVG